MKSPFGCGCEVCEDGPVGVTALGPSGNGSGSGNENPYLTFSHSVPAQVHLVAALGGLANRDAPRLFAPLLVPGTPIDAGAAADTYWRHYLTRPGAWLENTTWTNVSTLEQLVAAFPDITKAGVVLYDPAVPATSNLASTAAA